MSTTGETGSGTTANGSTAGMSGGARLFGVFTEPVAIFADVVNKPGFWPPLIALLATTIAATEFLLAKVGMERIVRRAIETSGRASSMSQSQMQMAVERGAKFGAIFAQVGAFIGVPLMILIVSAVGILIMKLVFGASPDFNTSYSVTAYAFLPFLISGILTLVVIGFGDPANMNPNNLSPTNIGFFLSQQSVSPPVYALATSLDFFTFWVMGLLGIGFASTSKGKVRPRSVFFWFLSVWLVFTLIKAGLSLI